METALRRARNGGSRPSSQRQPTARGQCGRAGAHRAQDAAEAFRSFHALVLPKMAEALGLSKSTVQRVWRRHAEPHRLDRYMASDDPRFEEKAADIIGLYMNPPQHAAVFCVDEKTAIQALDRLDPVLPCPPRDRVKESFEVGQALGLRRVPNPPGRDMVGDACRLEKPARDDPERIRRVRRSCPTKPSLAAYSGLYSCSVQSDLLLRDSP